MSAAPGQGVDPVRPGGRVAAVGARLEVVGLGLAGVQVVVAEDADEVLEAWAGLAADVGLVLLTPTAADVLGDRVHDHERLAVVLP